MLIIVKVTYCYYTHYIVFDIRTSLTAPSNMTAYVSVGPPLCTYETYTSPCKLSVYPETYSYIQYIRSDLNSHVHVATYIFSEHSYVYIFLTNKNSRGLTHESNISFQSLSYLEDLG